MNMTVTLKERLLNSKIVKLSKRIALPGFERIPLYEVAKFFILGIQKGALNTRATSLSFQFFLALFPSIIFLFTLIPFVPIPDFQHELLDLIREVLPESAYLLVASTLEDLITIERGGMLSIGFIASIYLATNGVDATLEAFSESIHVERSRNYFRQKIVAFGILSLLFVLLIVAITLVIIGEIAISYLNQSGQVETIQLLQIGRGIIILCLYYFAISFLYYYGNIKRESWRFFSAGSTLSTVLFFVLSFAFAYYVNNFAMYNKLYGSIGTLLVIMLWIYFNSFIILIGFELNMSIQLARQNKSKELISLPEE